MVQAGFRCVVPDHVGCGLSDKPQDYNYTLVQRIEDVESLLDHLKIDQFSLVVHDWGGAIGCGLAGRRPDTLKKLVLLNTGAFRSKLIPPYCCDQSAPYRRVCNPSNERLCRACCHHVCEDPLKPVVKRGLLWPYRSWTDRVAVWNFVKDIPLRKSHRTFQTLTEVEEGLLRSRINQSN